MCNCFEFLRWLIPCTRKREEFGDCGDYKATLGADCHGHGECAILEEEVVHDDGGKAESGAKHEQMQGNQMVLSQDSLDEASMVQNNSLSPTPVKLAHSVFEDKMEDEDHQECQYVTSAVSPSHFVEKLQSPSESNEERNDGEILMPHVQDTDVHQICLAQRSPSFSSEEKSPFVSEDSEEEMACGQISCSSQTTPSLQNVEKPGQDCISPLSTHGNRSLPDSNILPTQAPLASNSFIPPESMPNWAYNYYPYPPDFDPNSPLHEGKEMPQVLHGNQLPTPYGHSDGWNYHWSSMPLAHPDYFTYACVSPGSIVPKPEFLGMRIPMPFHDGYELFMRMIENDEVPDVLKMPLSYYNYGAYFAALLYVEDYYCERWGNFTLQRISVELHEESFRSKNVSKKENRTYAALNIAKFSEGRPYLLSRDFVYLKPSGQEIELFEGRVVRVVKGALILVEFEDDFYLQHVPENEYDIKFSFNRICLRRCHQAIEVAADPLFHNFTFPDPSKRIYQFIPTSIIFHGYNLGHKERAAVDQIMSLSDSPPYLIAGQLCLTSENTLSRTGMVIREAIIQIYTVFPNSRILVASPRNNTCDLLMESLRDTVPDHDMFRANAAFKEQKDVSDDIVDASSNNGDKSGANGVPNFFGIRLISSTFIGSSKLVEEGIGPGYFSHVFLLDASSATEPEIMVTLVSMASERTAVVVTGSIRDCPHRLRSKIARKYGLKRSYLHRLLEMPPYSDHDPLFVTHFFDMLPSSCK